MSDYEKRFHIMYGEGARLNYYTDDILEVRRIDREHGPVKSVQEGGSDVEDVMGTATQIGGQIHTRYENRVIPRDEWEHMARVKEIRLKIFNLLDSYLDIERSHPDDRREIQQKITDIAEFAA